MTELFSTVLNMSLTASVVIGVVLLLRFMLKNAPKVHSYALWSVVLFRLLCPVSPELGLSILPGDLGYHPGEQTMEIFDAMEPGETAMAAYHAVGDALNGGLGTVKVQIRPEYEEQMTESGDTAGLFHSEVWFLVFSRLWPTGIALMTGYSLYLLLCLRSRLKTAVLLKDDVYWAQGIDTPFVLGLVRPKIYLPAGILETEMPYIIRHEQYHIRRFDHVVKVLAFWALCLHWFNPLVWLAFVLAGKDMEMSCDEAVLREMGGEIRADYSQSLLSLATGCRRIAATPLAFGEGDPKGRIKNVLKWKKPSVKVTVIAALVCVIAAVLCISDPAKPVDTEQVTGMTFLYQTETTGSHFASEQVWVDEEFEVTEAGKEGLLKLIEGHSATRRLGLPSWEPRKGYGEFSVRLEMVDSSYYELRSWYVKGFSFHPAHFGEDEYDTTLAKYDTEGNLTACWTMEYDFDRLFRNWKFEQVRERLEQETETDENMQRLPDDAQIVGKLPGNISLTPMLYEAILDHHRSPYSDQYFCCASIVVLANEEGMRYHPVTGGDRKTMDYFLNVLYQEYRFTEDGIQDMGGAHIPTVVTMAENGDGSWSVLNYWEPRDGSYYVEDIRAIFPGDSAEEALHSQKYIVAQMQDCYAQAVEYARTDSDVKMDVDAVIAGLFEEICADPLPSSNAYSYLEAHPIEHRELLYYGEYTRDYCERYLHSAGEDVASGEMGLHRAIRELLLEKLCP